METCCNCGRPVSEEIEGYHILDGAPLCKECAKEMGVIVFDEDFNFPFAEEAIQYDE